MRMSDWSSGVCSSDLGLPTLGAIPISGADDLREELALPRSPMAEAYNSLRTALLYSTPEGMPPVVFVTSSGAGEGKSTTSYALAQGLASLDKRVVLNDGDLPRPAHHRAFGLSNDEGISDLHTSHREVGPVSR